MSWMVDGRYYHDHAEYQRALESSRHRQEARVLRTRADELQRRTQSLNDELRRAGADLNRQRQINSELNCNVDELKGVTQRLEQAQRQTVDRMNREFDLFRHGLEAQQHEIHELELEHERQVAEVNRRFQDVRHELHEGLQQAEASLQAAKAQLQREIGVVDAKVEADRQARLARIADMTLRAREALGVATTAVRDTQSRFDLSKLGLHERSEHCEEILRRSEMALEQGDFGQALGHAQQAFSETLLFARNAADRRAQLESARQNVNAKIVRVRSLLQDETVAKLFKKEVNRIEARLSRLEEKAAKCYEDYELWKGDARTHKEELDGLESVAEQCILLAPEVAEMMELRKKRAAEEVKRHVQRRGQPSGKIESRVSDPADPKSLLVVTVPFHPGIQLHLTFGLDGELTLHEYGHTTDSECGKAGQSAVQDVTSRLQIQHKESGSRLNQPLNTPAPRVNSYAAPGAELDKMDQQSRAT